MKLFNLVSLLSCATLGIGICHADNSESQIRKPSSSKGVKINLRLDSIPSNGTTNMILNADPLWLHNPHQNRNWNSEIIKPYPIGHGLTCYGSVSNKQCR